MIRLQDMYSIFKEIWDLTFSIRLTYAIATFKWTNINVFLLSSIDVFKTWQINFGACLR